jgi:hypothetical protein
MFPTDMTFTQGNFKKVSDHYSCFDLKSATDRFPAVLQRAVLETIIGKNKA